MWGELIKAVYDTYQQSKNKENSEADTGENKIEDIKTSNSDNTDNIINGATSILAPDVTNPAKSFMSGIGSLAKGIAGAIGDKD